MKRNQRSNATSSPAVQAARARAFEREKTLGLSPGTLGGPRDLIRWEDETWNLVTDDLSSEGYHFCGEVPAEAVMALLKSDDPAEMDWAPSGPMAIDLKLIPQMECIALRGKLDLSASHSCVRCLNDVPFQIPMELHVKLVEGDQDLEYQGSFDLDPQQLSGYTDEMNDLTAIYEEDEDLAVYQNGVIDLKSLLREQIFLELPMNPKCADSETEPREPCGALLSNILEKQEKQPDPRWAALAEISKKLDPAT